MDRQVNKLRFLKSERYKKALTKKQIKDIQRMYRELAEEAQKELKALSNRTVSDRIKKTYLDSYVKDINREITRINNVLEGSVKSGMLKISNAVLEEELERMAAYGLVGLTTKYSSIPTDVVATITSGQLYESKWSLSKAIWSANKKQHQKIYDIVAKGIAKNASLEDIAKALDSYVSPDRRKVWDMSRFYAGHKGKIDYNAMRLVKTMNNHAFNESFQRATEHDPFVEGYKWNNGHGVNVCPICEQLASDDWYGLGAGVYPKGDVPLDHPNGQCFLTIEQSMSAKDVASAIADWYNGEGDKELNKKLDLFAQDFGYKS